MGFRLEPPAGLEPTQEIAAAAWDAGFIQSASCVPMEDHWGGKIPRDVAPPASTPDNRRYRYPDQPGEPGGARRPLDAGKGSGGSGARGPFDCPNRTAHQPGTRKNPLRY